MINFFYIPVKTTNEIVWWCQWWKKITYSAIWFGKNKNILKFQTSIKDSIYPLWKWYHIIYKILT